MNNSLSTTETCSLKERVYTPDYTFSKMVSGTYLRVLLCPGILLNTLCLIVLSRPRLSNKSTTVVFLRLLAIFDTLAISLKFVRAEINYQSVEKLRDLTLMTSSFCKAIYVCMNASISISMWIIVLMSVDKAIAVSYPLKSSIWLTQKRASYICYTTMLILSIANLSFIKLADIRSGNNEKPFCGLIKDTLIIDVTTASILPIALITAINIVIAVTLHRVSRKSIDWFTNDEKLDLRTSPINIINKKFLSNVYQYSSSKTSSVTTDTSQATKRRTSAQVTRMLLAVTLSLIIFNIPNTIMFLFTRINDRKHLLRGRLCKDVSDSDIKTYKITFYISVLQDILSDLPHIVNFFLYCMAGRKFRSIFINEVRHCFIELHLIERKERRFTRHGSVVNPELSNPTNLNSSQRRLFPKHNSSNTKDRINVLFNVKTDHVNLDDENQNDLTNEHDRFLQKSYIHIF